MTRQVLVLVPAHNEEGSIGATIESLQRQTLTPATITVIADAANISVAMYGAF